MSYTIIAAIGKNRELGKDNKLIWSLPKDLKFFKEKTMGKTIIMGRKTFESLPRMLPNRTHIVLSHTNDFPQGVIVYENFKELIDSLKEKDDEYFIIGGSSIYKLFIDYADKMYLTEIDAECKEADAYFPEFNQNDYEKTIVGENEDNNVFYKHVLYRRY